jgi:large subunit ribosomal protein L3
MLFARDTEEGYMIGLIGKKIGMTQIYRDNGIVCPATAIEVGPCPVIAVKTADGRDGYNALKLGFLESKKISKPESGVFAKLKLPPMKVVKEFRVDNPSEYATGSVLKADVFKTGEIVSVKGTTKGRGFAGVVKRHGFSGGKDTHGVRSKRIPGSMGGSSDPSRVFRGKKLPGHYGDANLTVRGLEVVLVDPEKNVIFVKGAVPGARNGFVYVSKQS